MFRITDAKGFHITFANGYTFSVQFGFGNYCDNRTLNKNYRDEKQMINDVYSSTAEVAAWNKDGKDYLFNGKNGELGWLSPADVLVLMNEVASL